jgi:hypothetical protein
LLDPNQVLPAQADKVILAGAVAYLNQVAQLSPLAGAAEALVLRVLRAAIPLASPMAMVAMVLAVQLEVQAFRMQAAAEAEQAASQ